MPRIRNAIFFSLFVEATIRFQETEYYMNRSMNVTGESYANIMCSDIKLKTTNSRGRLLFH